MGEAILLVAQRKLYKQVSGSASRANLSDPCQRQREMIINTMANCYLVAIDPQLLDFLLHLMEPIGAASWAVQNMEDGEAVLGLRHLGVVE